MLVGRINHQAHRAAHDDGRDCEYDDKLDERESAAEVSRLDC